MFKGGSSIIWYYVYYNTVIHTFRFSSDAYINNSELAFEV